MGNWSSLPECSNRALGWSLKNWAWSLTISSNKIKYDDTSHLQLAIRIYVLCNSRPSTSCFDSIQQWCLLSVSLTQGLHYGPGGIWHEGKSETEWLPPQSSKTTMLDMFTYQFSSLTINKFHCKNSSIFVIESQRNKMAKSTSPMAILLRIKFWLYHLLAESS